MTQLPVGKHWCFTENALLFEDSYTTAPDKLQSFLHYGLLIIPCLSSFLAFCNSALVLHFSIREYYGKGPYLISYCLLKLIASCLVWITAIPRFVSKTESNNAGQKLSAQIPALLMTQQAFRLADTWLICFLMLAQVLIIKKLAKSMMFSCRFCRHLNRIHSCDFIIPVCKTLTGKTQSERQKNRRSYSHSIIWIGCIIIFSTLLTAPQIGHYKIEAKHDSLEWCVTHLLGSFAYEYALGFFAFLTPTLCFLVLLVVLSIKVFKFSQKVQRDGCCAYNLSTESSDESEDKKRKAILRESKFITLMGLSEFITWLPITVQDNLHRLSWIRNVEREANMWVACELILIIGDLLSQTLLATNGIYKSMAYFKSTQLSSRDGEDGSADLQTSRHCTSVDDSLEPLYTSQTSSKKPIQRKSILHVRLSPPPLPSPEYTYKDLQLSEQETFSFSPEKISCFYKSDTTSPFSYAFPEHEEIAQCNFPPTEEYPESANGVMVSHL
ncbi:hypothetical protein Aperf_G00000120820 [Anoplocephala perfoliata]